MSNMFPKSALLRPGYRPEQVDRYFETAREIYDAGELNEMDSEGVRTVAFDVVPGGYQPVAVDAALDRLEAAFLQRRRASFVAQHGRQAWMDQVTQLATTLYPRLLRPVGDRFAPADRQGYSKTDVDALMDRIAGYFDSIDKSNKTSKASARSVKSLFHSEATPPGDSYSISPVFCKNNSLEINRVNRKK